MSMKKKILWISLCAPYDNVGHGGGKTHNYYLKKVFLSNEFDIDLISFCDLDEYEKANKDLCSYGINHLLIPWIHNINASTIKRKIQLLNMQYNPFNKYGGATNEYYWDKIKELIYSKGYDSDLIILQWTEMVLFTSRIRKIFPKKKIIAIEEDVKFLGYKRQIKLANNRFGKIIATKKYNNLHKKEITELKKADLVITYSKKDEILLNESGVKHTMVISPFFEDYSKCVRNNVSKDLLFYGAMSRKDNYESAIWFIENVFNKIEDKDIRFIIVGNRPVEKLQKYTSDRIIITGFVDSIVPYFENCLLFVSPLISGAGVKIKVLEALSSGIPVLTNSIGIEGINAEQGKDYIHCEEPCEYIEVIKKIMENKICVDCYSFNSKETIKAHYDLENDAKRFIQALNSLA